MVIVVTDVFFRPKKSIFRIKDLSFEKKNVDTDERRMTEKKANGNDAAHW